MLDSLTCGCWPSRGISCAAHTGYVVGNIQFQPVATPPTYVVTRAAKAVSELWPFIQALERACWKRKWSEVRQARARLEAEIGKRPHDPLFIEQVAEEPKAPC